MMRQPQHVTMCVSCWMTRWFYDVVVCVCAWPCASSDSVGLCVSLWPVALVLHRSGADCRVVFFVELCLRALGTVSESVLNILLKIFGCDGPRHHHGVL